MRLGGQVTVADELRSEDPVIPSTPFELSSCFIERSNGFVDPSAEKNIAPASSVGRKDVADTAQAEAESRLWSLERRLH